MKIYIAEEAGFCFGVKRALEIINRLYKNEESAQIFGELIHNRTVLKDLEKKGINCIHSLNELDANKKLVIRTHGIPKEVENRLKKSSIKYIDATCPLVKKTHKIIENLTKNNTQIIIVGDKNHPEVIATKSYSKNAIIINSIEDAKKVENRDKISVIAQTTLDLDFFKSIVSVLLEKGENLEIYNTICSATRLRQKAIDKLAPKVDSVIVIGGKNSSNTKKLFEISLRKNPNTFYLEKASDLNNPGLINSLKDSNTIGITGGASTPPEEIERARDFIESYKIEREKKNGKKKRNYTH